MCLFSVASSPQHSLKMWSYLGGSLGMTAVPCMKRISIFDVNVFFFSGGLDQREESDSLEN